MSRTSSSSARERGTTTIEFAALAGATALLAGGVAVGAGASGGSVGASVAGRLAELLGAGPAPQYSSPGRPRSRARTGWVAEQRRSWGTLPTRVSRDDLRQPLTPPTIGAWRESMHATTQVAGTDVHATASACLACIAAEWNRSASSGGWNDGAKVGAGLEVAADASATVALASADLRARVRHAFGDIGAAYGDGRLRATVGGEVEAEATLRLLRDSQELEVRGGAMAGAVARAEGTVGVELLGIAISQTGRADGWAGAGARGVARLERTGGRLEWQVGGAAALGLGGGTEWSGAIDVSGMATDHRRLARDALGTALRVAGAGAQLFTHQRSPFS